MACETFVSQARFSVPSSSHINSDKTSTWSPLQIHLLEKNNAIIAGSSRNLSWTLTLAAVSPARHKYLLSRYLGPAWLEQLSDTDDDGEQKDMLSLC